MKEVIEATLGIFFLTIIMVASMSCIAASIDARNADATKTAYIAEMEESHFSASVLQSIFEQADSDGYDVEMTLYHNQSTDVPAPTVITSSSDIGDTSDVYMVRLQLKFDYSFQFLNVISEHTLLGYAR